MYIETVIEVDKTISSEKTSILNTDYHHVPIRTHKSTTKRKKYLFDMTSNSNNNHNSHHATDTSDDDDDQIVDQTPPPVNSSKQHTDSGGEFDHNSSTSTLSNSKPSQLLFPNIPLSAQQPTGEPLLRRVQRQVELTDEDYTQSPPITIRPYRRPKSKYFCGKFCFSFIIGFIILSIVLATYFYCIDHCSRQTIFRPLLKIITFEILDGDGIPTI